MFERAVEEICSKYPDFKCHHVSLFECDVIFVTGMIQLIISPSDNSNGYQQA